MTPNSTTGASTGDQVTPNRSLEISTHRCALNQFLHEAGIWSSSGTAAHPTSNRGMPSGTLNPKPKCTPSLARTGSLSMVLMIST